VQFDTCVDLNAVTRSLDLACKILSPTVAGLIMTYASLLVSGVVIAAWNVMSLIAEYTILSHVYRLTPALASKHSRQFTDTCYSALGALSACTLCTVYLCTGTLCTVYLCTVYLYSVLVHGVLVHCAQCTCAQVHCPQCTCAQVHCTGTLCTCSMYTVRKYTVNLCRLYMCTLCTSTLCTCIMCTCTQCTSRVTIFK